jgi:hypothetical protein
MRAEGNPLMEISTLECDVCGEQKSDKEQWFVAITTADMITFYPAGRWASDRWKAEDICGQECCHRRLSQWLDEANRQRSLTEEGR